LSSTEHLVYPRGLQPRSAGAPGRSLPAGRGSAPPEAL